jgi:hypothetical protein
MIMKCHMLRFLRERLEEWRKRVQGWKKNKNRAGERQYREGWR